jgi:hypothetical protein
MTSIWLFVGWRVDEVRVLELRDVGLEGKVIRLSPEISKDDDGSFLPLNGEFLEIVQSAEKKKRPAYR